jgi:hypothetical protein
MNVLRIPALAVALIAGAALVPSIAPAASSNSTVTVQLPTPTIELKPGPNRELAASSCLTCHSTDYIYYQPPLTKAQWTAEVNKMRTAYAAPIPAENVAPIVDYLMSQNGKS